MTPIGAILRGAVAGAAGTLAMDLLWYARFRRSGGEQSFADWEFSEGTDSFEKAAAPAQVGKRVIEGLFDTELPPETAGLVNNTVHWATGIGWGTAHGIVAGSFARAPAALLGPLTGSVAWAASYAVLAPANIYRPMWQYDTATLVKDWTAHVVFGLGTAFAFAALSRR